MVLEMEELTHMNGKMLQQYKGLLALVAFLAWSLMVFRDEYNFSQEDGIKIVTPPQDVFSIADLESSSRGPDPILLHRSLDLNQSVNFQHPPRNITIYLGKNYRSKDINPAYSLFHTGILTRYGSGRVGYIIHEDVDCRSQCINEEVSSPAPCLLVSREEACLPEVPKCEFSQCKTMITNDERCRERRPDVREYYSSNIPDKGYLPLGMRLDTWKSFQQRQLMSPDFYIRPASERKFAFNAVFSKNTNSVRSQVTKILSQATPTINNLTVFVSIAEKWHSQANKQNAAQLNTRKYIDVLLESVFTLCPAGHSPESFRIFEAVEAGTIPILSKNDLYGDGFLRHPCWDALHHWYDAPIIVLNDWKDLYPTVERLLADPAALNERQIELRGWYDKYMRRVIGEFEDFMLDGHEGDARASR